MRLKQRFAVVLLGLLILGFASGEILAVEKIKIKGIIKEYDVKEKTITITTPDKKEMTFVIESKKALDKLDDRLFAGDEVKIQYFVRDGKNIIQDTNDLKGTKPGC